MNGQPATSPPSETTFYEAPYEPSVARQKVLEKIHYRYVLTPEMLHMDDAVGTRYLSQCDSLLQSNRWKERERKCIEESHLTDEQSSQLHTFIHDALIRYGDAMAMRQHVVEAPLKPHTHGMKLYASHSARRGLTDAYINHTSNETQEQLTALGLTPASAISLHGLLIKASLLALYPDAKVTDLTSIRPEQEHDSKPSPEQCIHRLSHYWRHVQKELNAAHAMDRSEASSGTSLS